MLSCSGYLKALNKPNVTAVWDSLASVTKDEVLTTSGRSGDRLELGSTRSPNAGKTFSPDVLALATGFDTVSDLDVVSTQADVRPKESTSSDVTVMPSAETGRRRLNISVYVDPR